MSTGKAISTAVVATPVVVAAIAALPVEAVVVIAGGATAIAVMGACAAFGVKMKWNLGPWGFDVSKDQDRK